MSPDQTIDLLTMCAAYDQRTVGESDVLAWHSAIGDLDFTDAQATIVEHYREQTRRIMPADVRHGVRRIRSSRLKSVEDCLPDADPDDTRAWVRALREGRVRIADAAELKPRPVGDLIAGRFGLPEGDGAA